MGLRVPIVVLANPRISSPEAAEASGKPVIYIQGNIHGGEVEGKQVAPRQDRRQFRRREAPEQHHGDREIEHEPAQSGAGGLAEESQAGRAVADQHDPENRQDYVENNVQAAVFPRLF